MKTWLALLLAAATVAPQHRLRPPDVKYVPTPQSAVDAMLEPAHVTAADVVYDLGSGDGRIPITAAKTYGARGVGIEIDTFYLRDAIDNRAKAGVADRVTFVNQDLFEADISPATVVTLFLLPRLNQQLIPKLRRELSIDVDMVHGHYAEYKVLVDGQIVADGGALTALGVVPSSNKIVEAVRAKLTGESSA